MNESDSHDSGLPYNCHHCGGTDLRIESTFLGEMAWAQSEPGDWRVDYLIRLQECAVVYCPDCGAYDDKTGYSVIKAPKTEDRGEWCDLTLARLSI